MQSSKLNIVIIGPAYPLRGGGMATFNERMARALQDLGHTVSIYTFTLQYPSILFPGKTQYSTETAPKDLDIMVRINSVWPPNWISTGKEIAALRPDVVIVRYWLPFMGPALGTILRQIKKNKYSRIVCIADNILPHEKRPGDEMFTRYFVGPVDKFVVMSQKVLEDLHTVAPQTRSSLVRHPLYDNFGNAVNVNTAREKLEIEEGSFNILFFGFIRKYKGLDMLLEAMPEVISAVPNAQLIIAGEFYEDEKSYREIVTKLGIADHIIFKNDFVADADVPLYFSAADVVVQPYRNATQSGVTPLAYHFELPMVVTNVGGLPEMVPDNIAGLVAEPTPSAIAQKLIEYNTKGKQYFLPGLQEQKKLFSWDAFCEAVLAN